MKEMTRNLLHETIEKLKSENYSQSDVLHFVDMYNRAYPKSFSWEEFSFIADVEYLYSGSSVPCINEFLYIVMKDGNVFRRFKDDYCLDGCTTGWTRVNSDLRGVFGVLNGTLLERGGVFGIFNFDNVYWDSSWDGWSETVEKKKIEYRKWLKLRELEKMG